MTRARLPAAVFLLLAPVCLAAADWRYVNAANPSAPPPAESAAAGQVMVPTTQAVAEAPVYPEVMPVNYMSMEAVVSNFGQPESKAAPVGRPPISRWYYPDYTVYFEGNRVIISVAN